MVIKQFLSHSFAGRLANRLYAHLDAIPNAVQLANYWFYNTTNLAYVLISMIHIMWFITFLCVGQDLMMGIQLLSIGCYMVAIAYNRQGRHITGMVIGIMETIFHQVIAVYFLGADTGFQYLIPVIALLPFLKYDAGWLIKCSLGLACMASFLYVDIYLKNTAPIHHLSVTVVNFFNYSNIVLCFLLIALWGIVLTIAYQRTVKALVKIEQELLTAEMNRRLDVKERDNEIYRLKNVELKNSHDEIVLQNQVIEQEKQRSEALLLNILPEETALELLNFGYAVSRNYEHVTVMFTDFKGFTTIAEAMAAEELVQCIDRYFQAFDDIILRNNLEKIKTIGDAYMCAGGLPKENQNNAVDVANAAMEILEYMNSEQSGNIFKARIGLHSGPLIAGVVGKHKFQYDIWGDTVNIAARMEQNSEPGRINISGATFDLLKDRFTCEYRGKIKAKNKGEMDMYFINEKIAL